jgi:hypothetical protein
VFSVKHKTQKTQDIENTRHRKHHTQKTQDTENTRRRKHKEQKKCK